MLSSALPPPDPSDLLDRVASGDESARAQFFGEYAPRVFRFVAFTFGLDDDETDDVVQETMIAAFNGIDAFDRSRKIITWLFGIAKNKAADFFRDRMRTDLDEPVRAEVPWSSVGREEDDPKAGEPRDGEGANAEDGRTFDDVEAALGEAAARDEVEVEVEETRQAGNAAFRTAHGIAIGTRTPPPPPPRTKGEAPYRVWARGIEEWLATQPEETRIVARRFTHDASFAQLAADLSALKGKPVNEAAVRQQTSRFARDFAARFEQLLPRSRVRLPEGSQQARPRARRNRRVGEGVKGDVSEE